MTPGIRPDTGHTVDDAVRTTSRADSRDEGLPYHVSKCVTYNKHTNSSNSTHHIHFKEGKLNQLPLLQSQLVIIIIIYD